MIRFFCIILSIMIFLISSVTYAEELIDEGEKVEYMKRTVIDFSDVTIEGEMIRPEGSYLMNRKKTNFSKLIRARDNFVYEMMGSIDNL